MNENEIIEAVCSHLSNTGCIIVSRCSTDERGIDIIARQQGRDYYIEAKGGTSSRDGSARFGKPYTESQVFDRVAKGFYTAASLRDEKGNEPIVALALPDTSLFRKYVKRISQVAAHLDLSFYWVHSDKSVTEEHTRTSYQLPSN